MFNSFLISKIKLHIYFTLQTLLGFPNVHVLSDGERCCFGMQVMSLNRLLYCLQREEKLLSKGPGS